jgi:hypothetical protein
LGFRYAARLARAAFPRARLPIKRKRNSQGRIVRKRCGTSADISPAARRRAADIQDKKLSGIPF